MIRVAVTPLTDGLRLKAQGHAGYGPWGRDIVCAAVSALLYGFVAYLEGLPPASGREGDPEPHLAVEEGEGYLLVVTHGLGGDDLAAWRVIATGLSLISQAYPACLYLQDMTLSETVIGRDGVDTPHTNNRERRGNQV